MNHTDINPADYPPGTLIKNHPDYQYHLAPGLSSGGVKTFILKSPRHYYHRYVRHEIERKQSEAMLQGTLVHCLVLEPDHFERRYTQALKLEDYPDALRTVPDLKKYCQEHDLLANGVKQELVDRVLKHNPDAPVWDVMVSRQKQHKRQVVDSGLWDKARCMRDGVFDNPDAAALLSQGEAEVSVWAEYPVPEHDEVRHLLKCRADWLRADGICADLKTCACAAPSRFAKDCANLGYDLQAIHYTQTLNSAGIHCTLFAFIAVESEPPYLCQVYQLDQRSLAVAQRRYDRALVQLAQCQASDTWPGYTDCTELAMPGWHLKQLECAA